MFRNKPDPAYELMFFFSVITEPPAEVKIHVSNDMEIINLYKGFGEFLLNAAAGSYSAISCNSVGITWVTQTTGNVHPCQAEGKYYLTMIAPLK